MVKVPTPIMTKDQERFMAFEGLVQWTQATVIQSKKVSAAMEHQLTAMHKMSAQDVATLNDPESQHIAAISDPAAQYIEIMRHAEDRRLRMMRDAEERRLAVLAFHTECHFFAIAASKLIEFRDWVLTFGLCSTVDFSEIDQFSAQDIIDLRNMREHVVDYFTGIGRVPARWATQTPEYKADASSVVGNMIGGRLDWVEFGAAAERLLPKLLSEPIPYPPRSYPSI